MYFPPQPSEMEVESQVHLYGHTGEVTSLFVCKPYSILISVSNDGTCILWDLNRSVCVKGFYVLFFLKKKKLHYAVFVWFLSTSVFSRLCYVQSLTGHKSPVMAVSASETTGDIATVCDSGMRGRASSFITRVFITSHLLVIEVSSGPWCELWLLFFCFQREEAATFACGR